MLGLVARLWLGYGWLNAGYQKLFGSEKAAFWNGGGAGIKGCATAGAAGSKAGTGGASYGWFAAFLHGFVIRTHPGSRPRHPQRDRHRGNADPGPGLLTGLAAAAGLALNIIYMFCGSSGVNPAYAIVAVLLILAWRNAGYRSLDHFALPMLRSRYRRRPASPNGAGPAADHRARPLIPPDCPGPGSTPSPAQGAAR